MSNSEPKHTFDKAIKKEVIVYTKTFLKWTPLALGIGIVMGIIGSYFAQSIHLANSLRENNGWLLFLLPLAGLAIVFLYRVCRITEDGGTNLILRSARAEDSPLLRMLPLIFVSTFLTHLTGGSSGKEGAALQMGGSFSAIVGKRLKFSEADGRILIMCGMSAGFAGVFGTPLAAAFFSMEVVKVGILYYSAIVPCVISAFTAFLVSKAFGMTPMAFSLASFDIDAVTLIKTALLGILCAWVCIVFCVAMRRSAMAYKKLLVNPYIRVAVGGVIIVLLTMIIGTRDYNGAGLEVISSAVSGTSRPEAFILKIIFTSLTLGAGFKGGEIVPSLFTGATFGCAVAPVIGLDPSLAAAVGLTAVFCGVVNCPIASIILGIELFGAANLPFFAVACALSFMLSANFGLYRGQKIYISKTELKAIDEDVK